MFVFFGMYTCLIADDKLIQRDVMQLHLKKIANLRIAAVCANGLEAYEALLREPVDIVFSDIHMPELTGMELLKSLKTPPVFIFISDYPEYAAESYALDVIDYIVKPVTFERLLKAVNKAIEYIELKKQVNTPAGVDDHFFIRESSDMVKLRFAEVLYIESMGNFSKIHMLAGKPHLALVILKNLESQLPAGMFTRVHKQYIINHAFIASIGAGDITLQGNVNVPLSQSYRQAIMDKVVQGKIVNRNIS